MAVLKLPSDSLFFKFCGRLPHNFGPKYLMLSKPKLTLLNLGIIKSLIFLKLLLPCSLIEKLSYIISGEVSQYILKISVASTCKFFWCIETDLSFSDSSSKDVCLSLQIIRRNRCLFYCSTSYCGTSI